MSEGPKSVDFEGFFRIFLYFSGFLSISDGFPSLPSARERLRGVSKVFYQ